MRLLNVHDLTFQTFSGPSDLPRYAITSHRWQAGEEVGLKDMMKRRSTGSSGYKKIQGFAKYVKDNLSGVDWLWIDTCCIDQKSSQEVSGAINSMFRYYRASDICLAYLFDVESGYDIEQFEKSAWFKRGWTLQELVAPRHVRFLDQNWQTIGHRGHSRHYTSNSDGPPLAHIIANITQIPEDVLIDYSRIDGVAAEERVQWVLGRQTTEKEDLSYCLLGILGVTMPIIYGEGLARAMSRLLSQAEGVQSTTAQTLPLQLEVEELYRTSKSASQLLFLMCSSCCGNEPIPEFILRPDSFKPTSLSGDISLLEEKSWIVSSRSRQTARSVKYEVQIAVSQWLKRTNRAEHYSNLFAERLYDAIADYQSEQWIKCWSRFETLRNCIKAMQVAPHMRGHQTFTSIPHLWAAEIYYKFTLYLKLAEEGVRGPSLALDTARLSRDQRVNDLGEQHPDTLRSMSLLAVCERDHHNGLSHSDVHGLQRTGQAQRDLEGILSVARATLGDGHDCTIDITLDLVETLGYALCAEKAYALGRSCVDLLRNLYSTDRSYALRLCSALCIVAQLHIQQRLPRSAEILLTEALLMRKDMQPGVYPDQLENMHGLAIAYMQQSRWAEAQEILVLVKDSYHRLLGPQHPRTNKLISDLEQCQAEEYGQDNLQIQDDADEPAGWKRWLYLTMEYCASCCLVSLLVGVLVLVVGFLVLVVAGSIYLLMIVFSLLSEGPNN